MFLWRLTPTPAESKVPRLLPSPRTSADVLLEEKATPASSRRGFSSIERLQPDYFRETGLNLAENSFKEVSNKSGTPHLAMATPGLPCTTVFAGTGLVTTLPAVTTAPSPISTS